MNFVWIIAGVLIAAITVFVIIEHMKKALMTGLMIVLGVLILVGLLGFTYQETITGWISAWPF